MQAFLIKRLRQAELYTRIHKHAHTHTHTQAHKRTHADTHTHMARLKQPDIFKTGVFLVGKHHPSEKTLAFLQDYFGTNISRGHCFESKSAHLQPDGFAEKGDVALLKAAEGDTGPWGACQV